MEENLILINQDGSYNYRSFKGSDGTWTLIGSGMQQKNHKDVFLTLDSFKSDSGRFKDEQRSVIFNLSLDGFITPIAASEITVAQYDKKKWDRYVIKVAKTDAEIKPTKK